jgi:hypothetical protein
MGELLYLASSLSIQISFNQPILLYIVEYYDETQLQQ